MSNSKENYLTEKVEYESGVSVHPDHANNFDEYHEDVVGDEECGSDEEDRDKGKKRRGYDEQKDDSKPPSYMLFDVQSNEAGDKVGYIKNTGFTTIFYKLTLYPLSI